MNNKELYYKRLIREYDIKRSKAHQELMKRQEEVYTHHPQIATIDKELSQTGINLVRQMLTQKNEVTLENFRASSDRLLQTKKMLLVEAGYAPDYLDLHFTCSACKDTGFIGNQTCSCFKQALIDIAYEQSNIKPILEIENFSSFTLDYYSKEDNPRAHTSPYQNMLKIKQIGVGLIEKFSVEKDNLLLYGQTGLGKTFLCNCIAKELLDLGYTVLYFTAPQLFKLFEEERFHREDMEEHSRELLSTLTEVDLLIIDDLGTESVTPLTISDFFNVINSRYLNQTSTIISTNLMPNDWKERYSERIVSRIVGNYIQLKFIGEDIRRIKKYKMH